MPKKVTFLELVLKTLAGFGGGLGGTFILLLIFLLSSSVFEPLLNQEEGLEAVTGGTPLLLVFVFMIMIFVASLSANLLSSFFMSFTDRERYQKISTTLYQIFIINLVVLVFTAPLYFIVSSLGVSFLAVVSALQVIVTAQASALIMEVLADYRYALVSVYSIVFAILVAVGTNFFFFQATGKPEILLFVAIPIIWTSIGFFEALFGMFYRWMFVSYGTDFLRSDANLGREVVEEALEMPEEEKEKDVAGSDFLKKD